MTDSTRPNWNAGDEDVIHGHVKWFDAARGFGFVVSPAVDRDILLHINVLRNFGQGSIGDGSGVALRVQRSERGLQATEVLEIEEPDITADLPKDGPIPDYLQPIDDSLPYLPARVKWFDKAKGFGFANVFGRTEDVFIHIEVLRRFGLADLAPGEAVCLRAVDGARGKLALEVRRWEYFIE
ncbi:cold-shock protein [Jannaschia seohaensis]|uniref:Cold shock protein (Beta-ribbon, CspA family) n=1 Tax=Jannaschia seohaensis TaxID=475081 RepID=A0A2Y9AUE4_9RHOB|nr:cold shock protein [Jannaschia seohaensis]PWJ19207.1 CspA family cold shock protein [Jannaschia seohaensis]SSA45869.1 cold shock protein (beta-ribbon, CspA family) [Jannaschia seohaensis]